MGEWMLDKEHTPVLKSSSLQLGPFVIWLAIDLNRKALDHTRELKSLTHSG
jgi:hypothetical protein